MSLTTTSSLQILQDVFGYKSFRPLQEDIINHVLAGKNAMVIMPTGGGKSMCFQIPALLMNGLTLVVSPLIALMKDQVDALKAYGISVATLNSSMNEIELNNAYHEIQNGELKLLYVSPETALSEHFLSFITSGRVSLIAIDEAHCVSVWGNDFRPEYAQLTKLTSRLPETPIMALTATADKATREDILIQLGIPSAKQFIDSFERPNIFLDVQPPQNRLRQIQKFLTERPDQAGIIYCLSRKMTVKVSDRLNEMGYNAAHYHAGMNSAERHSVQEDFLNDKIQIVCATIAFGMGIDKSNIRFVIHYSLPKNVESYYQEIGRSGRDGSPATALLFSSYGDMIMYRDFIDKGQANDTFKSVQHHKLDRIWDYAQATNCRTNFMLNYFGEVRSTPCGHCDNCKNPPNVFNGTILAQKALSAVIRSKEQLTVQLLADVLRGSQKAEIIQRELHTIKTFGAGTETSRFHWVQYITQMINQGLLEIDYTEGSRLKMTSLGKEVVYEKKNVELTQARDWNEQQEKPKKISKRELFASSLFAELKKLRLELAGEEEITPTHIFTDTTLQEMTDQVPLYQNDLKEISGVSEHKFEKYGVKFLNRIRNYVLNQSHLKSIKGKTYLNTLGLYKMGLSPAEIANERSVSEPTIFNHYAFLYEQNEPVDILKYITREEIENVKEIWKANKETEETRFISERVAAPKDYHKIKLCLAYIKKDQYNKSL